MDYKAAGVDVEEGYKAVERYREFTASTVNAAVIDGIGSFAGLYSLKDLLDSGLTDPVLVSGTDGVGTKLDIAFRLKKYDTVGIDCVAMSVNDILCHGAKPLFFLDYLACGKLEAKVAAELVKGVAAGCREAGCALLGGETAEMPGFYEAGKYDMAGFAVGLVDRTKIITGSNLKVGDALIGLASSGVHSNGFSLIRKVIPDLTEDFGGLPIGLALLEPTRLYAKAVLGLLEQLPLKAMAHITGGGFYENIPRLSSQPFMAVIDETAWTIPPIFQRIAYGCTSDGTGPLRGAAAQAAGEQLLNQDQPLRRRLFGTFNMGIGFVIALDPADVETALAILDDQHYPAFKIGEVQAANNLNTEQSNTAGPVSIRFQDNQ